jgi:hypothetical protein
MGGRLGAWSALLLGDAERGGLAGSLAGGLALELELADLLAELGDDLLVLRDAIHRLPRPRLKPAAIGGRTRPSGPNPGACITPIDTLSHTSLPAGRSCGNPKQAPVCLSGFGQVRPHARTLAACGRRSDQVGVRRPQAVGCSLGLLVRVVAVVGAAIEQRRTELVEQL